MAFITAETRSDLIELSVAMLKQAPSAALLEELIALSVGGGSLADAADHIAKTAAFKAEYPSFQTAEQYAAEIFDNITTGGTVTADIRTAVIELATGMLTSGSVTKAGLALAIAEYLAAPAALLNTDFADIAQSFQNRADAAEYFVVTKELGGSTAAELAAAIASVTSDAATLTAANTAADATASAEAVVAGQTFTLTTGTDFVSGTAGNDLINAVRAGANGITETYSPVDQVAGGAGTDTLYAETDATAINFATVTGVENVQVNAAGTGGTTVTLANDSAYKELHSLNSIDDLTFSNIKNGDVNGAIIATANAKTTTYNYNSQALTGASDNLDVMLSAADGDLNITGATAANALETLTLNASSDSELDDIDLTNANTTKLVITGSGDLTIGGISNATKLNTYDASAATGDVTVTGVNGTGNTVTGGTGDDTLAGASGNDVITGGAGDDQITGGAGNDNLDGGAGNDTVILSSVTEDDVVKGGDGLDTLVLTSGTTYSATENAGVGISGFEVLASGGSGITPGSVSQNMKGLAENTITVAALAFPGASLVAQESAITTVVGAVSGSVNVGLATDGTADALSISLGLVSAASNASVTLDAVDIENLTVVSQGLDGNVLTLDDDTAGTLTVDTASVTDTDLKSITILGDKNLVINDSGDDSALASIDASGFTGNTLQVVATSSEVAMTVDASGAYSADIDTGDGADTITVGDGGTANANTVNGGDGADTIVAGAGNDTLNAGDDGGSVTAGAGDDTVSSGDGADTIVLGDGNDRVTDSGAGADVITGGAGNDTVVTSGAGADSIDGGAGNDNLSGGDDNDTILGGEGNDTLNGDAGNDSIVGGDGNDIITDGPGNDVVLGGDGVDTITISTGNDNVDAGAGNDILSISGLSGADTITGGDGTDTLTITNSSAGTLTPAFTSIESVIVNTSTDFALNLTTATDKTSLKTYNISSTDDTAADDVTLTAIASGSVVTISDDDTWDGAATVAAPADDGNLGEVNINTVDGGTLTLNVNANVDALVHTGTAVSAAAVTDLTGAANITITSNNGDANDIQNDITALGLDDDETQNLTLTANDSAGLITGDITNSSALQSITATTAAGAVSTVGTMIDAEALETLSVTATGAGASYTLGDLGGTTAAQLTSLNLVAASGGTVDTGLIQSDQSSALTSVTIKATGANSVVDLSGDGTDAIDLGTGTIGTLTIQADSNSTIKFADNAITSGAITTANITFADFSTLDGTGAGGTDDLAITGAITTANISFGRGVSLTSGETIELAGAITTLNLSSGFGSEAVDLDGNEILSVGGKAVIDFGAVAKANYTHTGSGALTWAGGDLTGNQVVKTNATSSTADTITGGAGNDTLTGNAGTDALTGGAGNDTLSGNAGVDTIDGGTGNDILTGGEGADIITTGTGNDTVVLTESTAAADDVKITNGGDADAATQATLTTSGDDTGADTITGFDAGASADSIVLVTATGVTNFEHTTDVVFGAGTNSGSASTGVYADYANNVLIFDMNGDGKAITNEVDMVINMNSLVIDGVAVTTAAHYSTALTNIKADLVYNITGTATADTITGGDGSDTITGGEGADVITLGTGNDNVVFTGAAITSATAADTIAGFNATSTAASLDKISFGSTFLGAALGSGEVSIEASNSIASDNAGDIIVVSNDVAGAGVISTFKAIMTAWSAAGNQSGVVVVDDGTDAYVYYVNDSLDGTATDVSNADVILIGTLSATDVSGMTAANFTAAI